MERVQSALVVLVNIGYIRHELGIWREVWAKENRFAIAITDSDGRPVCDNRNKAVLKFLQSGYGWMVMVDDDTVPTRNPLDWVLKDLDIVVFPTPMLKPGEIKNQPIHFNVELKDQSGIDGDSLLIKPEPLMEVTAAGAGCILIARRVLEHPDLRAPFMYEWDEDGIVTAGGDITFIRRAREAGFKAWAAMQYPCSHVREVNLLQMHDEFRRAVASARSA